MKDCAASATHACDTQIEMHGKSTLLKVLCGDEVADTGTIAWLQGGAAGKPTPAMSTITRRGRSLTPRIR